MLMLTHTWIMKEYLEYLGCPPVRPELYAYNVIPDILPVHQEITAEMTHGIERFNSRPMVQPRESFIRLHILVDDFSHFGAISEKPPSRFLPDSQGYTYVQGKPLIASIMALHCRTGNEIDFSLARYQSHMLNEMAFDMVLCRDKGNDGLLESLYSGLRSMLDDDQREASLFLAKTFGIATGTMTAAIEQISRICTYEGMNKILTDRNRTRLCLEKFGLEKNDPESQRDMAAMLNYGMNLVADYRDFLGPVLNAIRQSGFSVTL